MYYLNSKLIHRCNHTNSRFNLMKEESSIVSDAVFCSFLSSNRTLNNHWVPNEKCSSGKLSNETDNLFNFEIKPADWSDIRVSTN
jgi:hypothetical protein